MSTCGYTNAEPDVWYRYVAPKTGRLHASTSGTWDMWGMATGMDTVLSLHQPDGTPISGMCNDDIDSSTGSRDSLLEFLVYQGEEVLVRVTRYGGSTGTAFMLETDIFPPEPSCVYDFDRDGDIDGLDLAKFAAYYQVGDMKLDIDWNGAIDDDEFTTLTNGFGNSTCGQ